MKLFTEDQVTAIRNFVQYLQEQLELEDWRIKLIHEPADLDDSNCGGSINPLYGQRYAQLRLAHDFFEMTIEEMERILVHELCHLLSTFVDDVIDNGLEEVIGKSAFTMFNASYRMASERMVDHQTTIVLSLIEDGENRKELVEALNKVRGEGSNG